MANVLGILFVDDGNVCRSPMAEYVMKDLVNLFGPSDRIYVASCGCKEKEIGSMMYDGARRILDKKEIPYTTERPGRLINRDCYKEYDIIVAMDKRDLNELWWIFRGDREKKCQLLLSYASENRGIMDPWYTGDFEKTYQDILSGCEGLLRFCQNELRKN